MRTLMTILMLLGASFAGAAPGEEVAMQLIEADLVILRQEREALQQDFRMTQDMRDLAVSPRTAPPAAVVLSAPLINYDDMVREREAKRVRIAGFDAELSRLYDASVVLADRERALRAELRELVVLHRQ